MQEISPLWNQIPSRPLWAEMPLSSVAPSTPNAAPGQSTSVATPINTWARDLQVNPWTATRPGRSFGEIFQNALEQVAEPVAQLVEPVTDIFDAAVDAVKETDATKTQMEYLMATGQLDNPAALSIASTKAQLSVQLLVQLRNRALDAYNELVRINL